MGKIKLLPALMLIIALTGCSGVDESPKPAVVHCTLTVNTSYSGTGIAGQDLGSGSFTKTFEVTGGESFYEDGKGRWSVKRKDPNNNVIAQITTVSAEGVSVMINDKEITLGYGDEMSVYSTFVVYDGINYYHTIAFSDYSEQ